MPHAHSQSKASTYSHLLYLDETERANYMTKMSGSVSSASSIHSAHSESAASHASTTASSVSRNSGVVPKWACEHYPLITSTNPDSIPESVPRNHSAFYIARTMAQIHNTIIRAINSSYNHAIFIEPGTKDAEDFLFFNQVIFKTIDHHHHTEDDFMFPEVEKLLNKPGAMEENTVGHESFAEGLAVFEKYVSVTKPSEFNGQTFRHIVDSFAPDLVQHLHAEIPTLLSLHTLDSASLRKVWDQAGKIATKDATLAVDFPFILSCQDKELTIDGFKCTFPDAPWVLEAVVRNWLSKKHASVWRFSPCDMSGQKREFVPVS